MPYAREADILYRQWSKWMLNVGCNQVCMVFDKGYGPCMEEGSLPFALMTGAMREVCALAEKEGIPVGEKEVEEYLAILRTLDPDAVPMRCPPWARTEDSTEGPRWSSLPGPC